MTLNKTKTADTCSQEALRMRIKPGYDIDNISSMIIDHLMCGVAVYELFPDRVGAVYLSDRYYDTVGYTKEAYEQYIDNVTGSLYEDSVKLIFEKAAHSVKTGETFYGECRGKRQDGSNVWVLVKAQLVDFIESDNPVFLAIVQDITARKTAEFENAINVERNRILEATSNAVTFEYDIATDVMTFFYGGADKSANRSITNYSEASKRTQIVFPQDTERFFSALNQACRRPVSCEILDYRSTIIDQNNYRWVRTYYSSVADATGRIVKVLGRTQDIDDDKRERQRMTELIETDSTTGLLNKLAITNHIQELIREKAAASSFFAMLDIDDFKNFNDTYGHSFGDEVLYAVGRLLSEMFPNAVVGRFGGDEFIVFLRGKDKSVVLDEFERFIEEAQKIEIDGKHYPIRSSIGIAWTKENCRTYSEYFDEADELLYTAKKSGKCRICHKQID